MDMKWCKENVPYPSWALGWGSAGTQHSYERFKLSHYGLSSGIEVKAGSKWVAIANPKGSPHMKGSTSTTLSLSDGHFFCELDDPELWELEAVLLTPGTRL